MFFLSFFQASAFIFLSWLGGKFVCDRIGIAKHATNARLFVYATGFGYGIFGTAGLIFALGGLYAPASFYALALFIMFLARDMLRGYALSLGSTPLSRHMRDAFAGIRRAYGNYTFVKIIVTLWVALYLAISLLPSAVDYNDGLYYHIPFSMEMVQTGSLSFPVRNDMTYGHLPLFVETLYGIPMTLFHNFVSFKVIQLSAYFLLLLLLIDLAKRYARNELSVWLLVLLLLANMPLANSALNGGMIDIFTFFFGLASVLILAELAVDPTKPASAAPALLVSGIFLGLALATKYLALFFGVLCFMLLAWFFLKHTESVRHISKQLLLYVLPVIALGSFWYIKNTWYTGNPVFPLFSAGNAGAGFQDSVNRFVLERTLPNFLIFPFFLFGKALFFLPYPLMTAASFAALYAMTALLFFKKRIAPIMLALFACMELYLLMLFFFSHQIRFAVPALVLSAVLIALALDALCADAVHRPASAGIGILAAALFAVSMGSATLADDMRCLTGIKPESRCLIEKVEPYIHAEKNNLQFYHLP